MNAPDRPDGLTAQAREIFDYMHPRADPPDTFFRLLGTSLWLFAGLSLMTSMAFQFSGTSLLFAAIAYAGIALYAIITRQRVRRLLAADPAASETNRQTITVYYLFFVGVFLLFLAISVDAGAIGIADGLPDTLKTTVQNAAVLSTAAVFIVVFALGPRVYRRLFGYGTAGSGRGVSRTVPVVPFAILLGFILMRVYPEAMPYLSIPCIAAMLLVLAGAAAMLYQGCILWLAGVRNSRH